MRASLWLAMTLLAGCAHPSMLMSHYPKQIEARTCNEAAYYPPYARQLGIEGKVTLRVHLDENGRVVSAKVLHGLGYGLDESARDALLHACRFTPAIDAAGARAPFDFVYTWPFWLHGAADQSFHANERVTRMPEIDAAACARAVRYPREAQELGIEGDVQLRVHLDASGRVEALTLVKGAGHGLDEAAQDALLHRCHFTPALGVRGTPIPIDIPYTWVFELPDADQPL